MSTTLCTKIGIDTGKHGAICLIKQNKYVYFFDIPMYPLKNKNHLHYAHDYKKIIKLCVADHCRINVERIDEHCWYDQIATAVKNDTINDAVDHIYTQANASIGTYSALVGAIMMAGCKGCSVNHIQPRKYLMAAGLRLDPQVHKYEKRKQYVLQQSRERYPQLVFARGDYADAFWLAQYNGVSAGCDTMETLEMGL